MSAELVVDASVAFKWLVAEPESEFAARLVEQDISFHAPTLLRAEICNAFWKSWRRGASTHDQAVAGLATIERTITRWHAVEPLLGHALDWSLQYDHPIYDFCYLALAGRLGVPFVTADARLLRKLAGTPEARLVTSLSELA